MKKLAVLSAAALIGVGPLTSTPSEARDRGGAIAAGVVGGLAAGALIGVASNAYAAPHYASRPVVVREIVEDDVEECRMIVKRRYNAYGDLVVKRIRVCD